MHSARVLARSVFPTPVGPSNAKVPMGRRGSFKSPANGAALAHGRDRLFLADHGAGHFFLHLEQALRLPLFHALEGGSGHFETTWRIAFLVNLDPFLLAVGLPGAEQEVELFLGLAFPGRASGRRPLILLLDGLFLASLICSI